MHALLYEQGALPCLALFDDAFTEMCEDALSRAWSVLVERPCRMLLEAGRFAMWAPVGVPLQVSKEESWLEATGIAITNKSTAVPLDASPSSRQARPGLRYCGMVKLLDLPFRLLRIATALLYRFSIAGLFIFMVYKMKDPLFELFGPAPWINSYDDYFFTTSQGVFGFVNRLRINYVLEFRHGDADDATWRPLDFKCLPGSLDRTPCLLSPYHSRLDWETWIRTTASFEHAADQYPRHVLGQALHQNTPDFLRTLIQKILAGDENAARLTAADLGDLYYPGSDSGEKVLPSAMRASFFLYEFQEPSGAEEGSSWAQLLGPGRSWGDAVATAAGEVAGTVSRALPGRSESGNWYKREPLDQPGQEKVYRREGNGHGFVPYAGSHPSRHWVCGLSVLLAALVWPEGGERQGVTYLGRAATLSLAVLVQLLLLGCFLLALFSDYSAAAGASLSKRGVPSWIKFAEEDVGSALVALAEQATFLLSGSANSGTSASDLSLLPIRTLFGVASTLTQPALSVAAAAREALVRYAEEAVFPVFKTWIRALAAAVVALQMFHVAGIACKPGASAARAVVVFGLSALLFRHALLLQRGHGELRGVGFLELLGSYMAEQLGMGLR